MTYNPYTLAGKTILITGASSGIGRATAVECSKLGARLVLSGRDQERLEQTRSMLEREGEHMTVVCDLLDEESIKALVEQCPDLDGCVSNAGVTKRAPLKFFSEELFDSHFKTNVLSPMLLVKYLLRKKKLRACSSVVFTSSVAGVFVTTNASGMYGSSKSALNSYMKYAALELAEKKIRCNAVNPGMIETSLIEVDESEKAKDLFNYPLGTYGETEDVALAIVYLLSDASKWVTGTELKVDGGRSLK